MLTLPRAEEDPPGVLGLAWSFSGLALLAALLVALPFLPLSHPERAAVAPVVKAAIPAPAPRDVSLTIHVVANDEQYKALLPYYPKPSRDLLYIVPRGSETIFGYIVAGINDRRAAEGLPPALLNDLRP